MADAVTSQTLVDNDRVAIMKFTNVSDGTGETKVIKVDASALSPSAYGKACDGVTLTKVYGTAHDAVVDMYWDATTDVLIENITPNGMYTFDYEAMGGLWNNAGAGKTGNILFSTHGAIAGSRYTIILEMVKHFS